MKKNNILVLSHDYYPDNIWGVGETVYNYINSVNNEYNIVLYTTVPRKGSEEYHIITPTNYLYNIFLKGTYIENNSYRDTGLLSALNRLMLKRIISFYEENNIKPDIILNHGWMTWEVAQSISEKYHVPIITFVHFYEKQYLQSNNNSTKSDWGDIYKAESLMFKYSDKLIVYSDNQKEELSKLYEVDKNKLEVIPHSIDLPNLPPKKRDDKKVRILFVGRLILDKGIIEVLQVFENLNKRYNNLELIVVGDGVLKEKVKSLSLKKVVFKGWMKGKELYENYNYCDIFCFPTKTETFGIVLLEAMKYRMAILTTEGNTVSNIIKNNETGLTTKLINSNGKITIDTIDLEEKLEKLIIDRNLRKKLGDNAFNHYNNKYKDSEIKKINRLVEKILNDAKEV